MFTCFQVTVKKKVGIKVGLFIENVGKSRDFQSKSRDSRAVLIHKSLANDFYFLENMLYKISISIGTLKKCPLSENENYIYL